MYKRQEFPLEPVPDEPELEDPTPVPVIELPEFPVEVAPVRLVLVIWTSSGAQRPSPSQLNPVGQDEHAVPSLYIEAEAMLPPTA